MPAAQKTITIKRPVEAVFAFVADGENSPRWRSGVLDVERVSGSGVGTTIGRCGRSDGPPYLRRFLVHGLRKLLMGSSIAKTMESEVSALDKLKEALET